MKKTLSIFLTLGLIFLLFTPTTSARIKEKQLPETETYLGTFVEYRDEHGNLITAPYSLDLIQEIEKQNTQQNGASLQCIACVGDFTYTTYDIYDQGIIKSWSWLSNPYFIISIARGATYTETTKISTTITASYEGDLPSKAAVNSKFGISASGTKSFSKTITLSGPESGYSSRDFYYKKGRHTHKIKTVSKLRKKGGTVISTKTHYGKVGVPAVKNYSVDTK